MSWYEAVLLQGLGLRYVNAFAGLSHGAQTLENTEQHQSLFLFPSSRPPIIEILPPADAVVHLGLQTLVKRKNK